MIDIAVHAAAALVVSGCAWQFWAAQRAQARIELQLMQVAVEQGECARLLQNRAQLETLQQAAESGVEGTTALVQSIHKGIASIPFGVLEAIPATRSTTRLVRGIHDLTSAGVYGGISAANRGIGRSIRKQLSGQPPPAIRKHEDDA